MNGNTGNNNFAATSPEGHSDSLPGLEVTAGTAATSQAGDTYFWLMTGMLMLFVLVFLLVLKQIKKARLAAYPEILSGFTKHYRHNRQRRIVE